jgi:hypothetical protein
MHSFDDLLKTGANVLFVSGTKDISSLYADQIVLDSYMMNKFNIQTRLYENANHSLFEVDSSGKINYEVDKWENVFADFVEWFEKKLTNLKD